MRQLELTPEEDAQRLWVAYLCLNVFWMITQSQRECISKQRSRVNKIRTYDLRNRGALAEANIDHREPRGRFTEPREEGLELLGSAYAIVEQQFQEIPLVVVNGDPEGESAKDLEVLVGEILRDGLGERLSSLPSSGLSLHEQGPRKHVLVAVDNTKDERTLILQQPQLAPGDRIVIREVAVDRTDLEKIQRRKMAIE